MSPLVRNFQAAVGLVGSGKLTDRLDEKLREIHAALEESSDDAKASLQVNLTFQRVGDRTEIRAIVKMTLPADKPIPPLTVFMDDEGFSLQHPSQTDMFSGPRAAGGATASK